MRSLIPRPADQAANRKRLGAAREMVAVLS